MLHLEIRKISSPPPQNLRVRPLSCQHDTHQPPSRHARRALVHRDPPCALDAADARVLVPLETGDDHWVLPNGRQHLRDFHARYCQPDLRADPVALRTQNTDGLQYQTVRPAGTYRAGLAVHGLHPRGSGALRKKRPKLLPKSAIVLCFHPFNGTIFQQAYREQQLQNIL